MAGEAIRFDLRATPDTRVLSFAASRMAKDMDDMSSLFEEFDPLFQAAMGRQFSSQGGYGAGGWAALSPAYRAWKVKHGFPGTIGVLHGHLRAGMTGGSGYTAEITNRTASYGLGGGPATEYGRYFDSGGSGPARPVIRMPQTEGREWGKVAHKWIASQARKSGWGSL